MKLKLRKGQVMPRGWHYQQEGYDKPIKGYSRTNLIDEVGKFRVANHLEFGNPEQDVTDYVCSKFPRTCTEDYTEATHEDDIKELVETTQRTNLEEIRLWSKITAHRRTQWGQLEREETAQERTAICEQCPKNTPISAITQCHPCVKDLNRSSTLLREGRKVSKNLGYCQATFQNNSSAVFLPKEGLERSLSRVEETVPECWLRRLE